MSNQWLRLLLLRCQTQSQPHISRRTQQVKLIRLLTNSPAQSRALHAPPAALRAFSSSSNDAVGLQSNDVMLNEIFSRAGESSNKEAIKLDLDSKNVVLTHDLVLDVLKNPETAPELAKRVFQWVLENDSERLSSKSYNWMLGILGGNGFVDEFWEKVEIMKMKGYGVKKGAFVRALEKFEKDGLNDDVEKLKALYASGSMSQKNKEASSKSADEKVCKIIKGEVWGDDVEKQVRESGVEFSSDLISMVLGSLEMEPNKGLIFFRWVEESGLFKHDEQSFNALARVLGREDYTEKFWKVVNEMRGAGYQMEKKTYMKVLEQFVKSKMIQDAVDLYEFAMMGENKPSVQDCTFLLKKIVVGKELDMDLFLKVVKVFKATGNELTDANLRAVLKSLTSVGRLEECNRILGAMEEGGYLPRGSMASKIAFELSSHGKTEEAWYFMASLEASENADHRTRVSLVKGYCASRDMDKACDGLWKIFNKEGDYTAHNALELVIRTYCRKNRPMDAYKLFCEMRNLKDLRPTYPTCTELVSKLLAKKRLKEALDVTHHMEVEPFFKYLSKFGTVDDAVMIAEALKTMSYLPTSVYLRLFEAFLKTGRQSEAQDFLSKCPKYIRNHADVLNLFCSVKPRGQKAAKPVAASV